MKLSTMLMYDGNPRTAADQVVALERAGLDSVWVAEAYGSDALTPLAWWGAATNRIKLGTSICQISARTPTAMANSNGMAASSGGARAGGYPGAATAVGDVLTVPRIAAEAEDERPALVRLVRRNAHAVKLFAFRQRFGR